jgi:D-methionine transport system substrate-binding protein
MKKINKFLSILIIFSIIVLAGCSATDSNVDSTNASKAEEKTTKLVVGATPVPHAEILNFVKPILKEKGIELEIKEFTDYTTPNIALNDKQLDANFFQHIPYMDDFAKEKNIKLVAAAKVHVEPMGVYSNKIKSIGELKNDASIAIPNDATNEGRALLLLQKQGLIKLKDEKNLTQTPKDIIENPKNLKFKELEAAQLPRVLQDVDIAVINTNYALEAKLNPTKDALFIEDKDSPYANILAVRPDNEKDPKIMELVKILNSDDVKKFINEKYSGAIVPAF